MLKNICLICGRPYWDGSDKDYYTEKHGRVFDKHHIHPSVDKKTTVYLCTDCHRRVHALMREGLTWEEIYV